MPFEPASVFPATDSRFQDPIANTQLPPTM